MREINRNGCAGKRCTVDIRDLHLGAFFGGCCRIFFRRDWLIVPFDQNGSIQFKRDFLFSTVKRYFHFVFTAVFALNRNRNRVIPDRQNLNIFRNVSRFTNQRRNVCTVDDNGGASFDIDLNFINGNADICADGCRLDQADRGKRNVNGIFDRIQLILIALLRISNIRRNGHIHRIRFHGCCVCRGFRIIPHIIRYGDRNLAIRNDIRGLHFFQVNGGVFAPVNGNRMCRMVIDDRFG